MVDVTSDEYKKYLSETGHKVAKCSVTIGEKTSDIYIELLNSTVPNTCAKFLELCGSSYTGLSFERVLRGGFVQTGKPDVVEVFPDESFSVPYEMGYMVGMSNDGPHTNSGQFFITLSPAPYLSSKYVAFGKVVSGFEAVDSLGEVKCVSERPVGKCVIDSASEVSM